MLYKINETDKSLGPVKSSWTPKELELENYLISYYDDGTTQVLSESVFGEPLLFVQNQVRTGNKKRADILALDRAGNAVVVELKKDRGLLGVETQALQYLADFSSYKGEMFLSHFRKDHEEFRNTALSFFGDTAEIEDINKNQRIILVAREFDETLYSLGEWISSKGVPFRCVTYSPYEIGDEKYLTFSVAFDRSPESLFQVNFASRLRDPKIFWHNIAFSGRPEWWNYLVNYNQISTGFSDSPGDKGEKILKGYIPGDKIIAYAKGYGAVGWADVTSASKYRLLKPGHAEDLLDGTMLHRLSVTWKATAKNLTDGIPAEKIYRDFGIYHPVSTSVSMDKTDGERLIKFMSEQFGS